MHSTLYEEQVMNMGCELETKKWLTSKFDSKLNWGTNRKLGHNSFHPSWCDRRDETITLPLLRWRCYRRGSKTGSPSSNSPRPPSSWRPSSHPPPTSSESWHATSTGRASRVTRPTLSPQRVVVGSVPLPATPGRKKVGNILHYLSVLYPAPLSHWFLWVQHALSRTVMSKLNSVCALLCPRLNLSIGRRM